eukprot:Trichotokara_eunicae@DN1874_c0_g1_i1.p1
MGVQHHPSPFLQMSFETSMRFLTDAVERGAIDDLRTPAGAIVVGKQTIVGTGMSRVLTSLSVASKKRSETIVNFMKKTITAPAKKVTSPKKQSARSTGATPAQVKPEEDEVRVKIEQEEERPEKKKGKRTRTVEKFELSDDD